MSSLTPSQLMFQAKPTIDVYFKGAMDLIEGRLGEDFSTTHPDAFAHLVGVMIQAMAQDFHTAMVTKDWEAREYVEEDFVL